MLETLQLVQKSIKAHQEVTQRVYDTLQNYIYTACVVVTEALKNGNKIMLCGNGGSAGDAQHIATELCCRYNLERKALACIALTTDTSVLTAVGNDYGFDRIFDRQVEALAKSGDVLIGISTSGQSKNVVRALSLARNMGCRTIGLSGRDGGVMNEFCDINIVVPSEDTARIQEMHILIGHIIAEACERMAVKKEG